jgi:hypothetical protein
VASQDAQENPASGRREETPSACSGHWHALFQLFRLRRRRGSTEKPDKEMRLFRLQVENARSLLAFGITEGRRCKEDEPQLTPEIIEQITKAEDLLHLPTSPSWQERAEFEKAYWLLTRSLSPVSASLLESSPLQQRKWFWSVMAGVYLFSVVLWSWVLHCILGTPVSVTEDGPFTVVLFFALLSTAIVGFIWRFSYWFTGVVTRQKLNKIISFCYSFTLVSILSPILMTGVVLLLPPDLYRIIALDSLVGITLGCSSPLPDEASNSIPPEVRCGSGDKENYQWLINIGGVPAEESWQKSGLSPENWRRPRTHINGGLVVPVYIIVLAFMGGAISMTRRVPEYQRRTADPCDPMTPEIAREHLVFQIMQVVSAPLIAVTIYHLFGPTSRATSIVLGFASGFASEPILQAIRALVEKLKPTGSEDTERKITVVSVAKDRGGAERDQTGELHDIAKNGGGVGRGLMSELNGITKNGGGERSGPHERTLGC